MKTMIFMVYAARAMPIPSRPVGQCTRKCFTASDTGFRRNSRESESYRKIYLLSDDTSKIPRHRRVAEAFTTPAYLVIGWPFIVDYWQKKAFELPRKTGTSPVRSTSLPSLRGCSLGKIPVATVHNSTFTFAQHSRVGRPKQPDYLLEER